MYTLKIRRIGNSAGVTLPKEALGRLELREGDTLTLTVTKDSFVITPYDEKFAAAMEAYDEGSRKYRNALRELAK